MLEKSDRWICGICGRRFGLPKDAIPEWLEAHWQESAVRHADIHAAQWAETHPTRARVETSIVAHVRSVLRDVVAPYSEARELRFRAFCAQSDDSIGHSLEDGMVAELISMREDREESAEELEEIVHAAFADLIEQDFAGATEPAARKNISDALILRESARCRTSGIWPRTWPTRLDELDRAAGGAA